MHLFDRVQYSRILNEARRRALEAPGAEICGLIVHTGYHLSFVSTRNVSRRQGSFQLSRPDVRRIVAAAKVLHQEIVGTFHSHPAATAFPGPSDIANAVDDSLMFIFDCVGRAGGLWKIKRGKARELPFGFSST
jgi:proteasome lid subunit RPN8/RPN11